MMMRQQKKIPISDWLTRTVAVTVPGQLSKSKLQDWRKTWQPTCQENSMGRISKMSDMVPNDRRTGITVAEVASGISKCLCCTEIHRIATWNVRGMSQGK